MKRLVNSVFAWVVVFACLVNAHENVFAQNADAIVGKWYTANDKSIVEVWKSGSGYCGKIIWLRDSLDATGKPKVDNKNSEESRHKTPLIGLQMLSNLKFKDNEWVDGSIYDPENGKEYSCKATFNGDKLDIRGYVLGMPFLGRTTTWRRK